MAACAKLTAMGLATTSVGLILEAFAIAATVPTFGSLLPLGTPIAVPLIVTRITCITEIMANASVGGGVNKKYQQSQNFIPLFNNCSPHF